MVSGSENDVMTSRTLVDSAVTGSQDLASFFSTPVSLPASGPATTATAIQKSRTSHLVLRPVMMSAVDLVTASFPLDRARGVRLGHARRRAGARTFSRCG